MIPSTYHIKDISQTSFLVTGGAGFIGSNIVEYLLANNAKEVRVIDNFLTGRKQNLKLFLKNPAFNFIEGDIRDKKSCEKACEGIDIITHQAALGSVPRSVKDPISNAEHNIFGFINMLEAARKFDVKRFVYASSSSVYGDEETLPKVEHRTGRPLSPYAVSKQTNELYARIYADLYGIEFIGLRYFNVFGPNQRPDGPYAAVIPLFIDKVKNGQEVFIHGDGMQTRDFTFVANAVQANVRAMLTSNDEALNEVYNIAYGENYSIMYLFNHICDILEKKSKPIHTKAREGDIRNSLADISKAEKLLNYQPTTSLKEGLLQTIKYFENQLISS